MKVDLVIALGITGLGVFTSSSVSAQQTYASGSSTIVLMNGASQSIGGEISVPKGFIFGGATPGIGDVSVNLTTIDSLDTNSPIIFDLTVNPGAPLAIPSSNATSIETVVADLITNAPSLADGVSYTRAWRRGYSSNSSSSTQAYASGSSTIVLMNGASQSIGAEIGASKSLVFLQGVIVTPVLVDTTLNLSTNAQAFFGLAVDPGTPTLLSGASPSVEVAVAGKIDAATSATIADGISYIRAWRSGNSSKNSSSVQAYASGSSSFVLMNGASQSIGAEIGLAGEIAFQSPVLVIPTYQGGVQYLSTNTMIFENLTVNGGLLTSGSPPPSASVEVAAATQLTNAANLSDAISYIRAWAGEGGGLE